LATTLSATNRLHPVTLDSPALELPEAFAVLCQDIQEGKTRDNWLLKGRRDAYGNYLSNSDIDFLVNPESIQTETERLRGLFGQNGCFEADPDDAASPGFVEVTNMETFVCFGYTGSGEPFFFDFRQDTQEPSIITWNDAYWQRVAPNFETFLRLFAPGTEEQWEAWRNRTD
jgi:hypothetical protein